jgi:hypothetical protein
MNMPLVEPQHSLSFRQEVLLPLFDLIRCEESCCVIGASSMGKTRLLDFIMRTDVQTQYLGEIATKVLFIRVDMNRIGEWSDLGFYELLMSTIATSCSQAEVSAILQEEFIKLMSEIMLERDELRGLRFVELAIEKLRQQIQGTLCFIFDEFDIGYSKLSNKVLANLRGIRDKNRVGSENNICYILMLRNSPEYYRTPSENEGFYEIVSRNIIGLGPCSKVDSLEIIQQFESQRRHPITPDVREWLYQASGGHPGLISALFNLLLEGSDISRPENFIWVSEQGRVVEECRKLWESLLEEEKAGLVQFAQGHSVYPIVLNHLKIKGLLRTDKDSFRIFSPILRAYIQSKNLSELDPKVENSLNN